MVSALTGRVRRDDPRMYGWAEKRIRLEAEGHSWSLSDFLTHVKGLVLNSRSTKQLAWEELQSLRIDAHTDAGSPCRRRAAHAQT